MSSSSDSDELLILHYYWRTRIKHRRQMWVREIFLHREQKGEFHQLIPQLVNDEEKFYSYYRMNKSTWNLLISKLKPLFIIGSTNYRSTISFEERLTVTLRYLVTGESFHSASFRFRISHNRISVIVNEMLLLIHDGLKNKYLQFPTKKQFEKIAEEFRLQKNFPHCIGAIDGKHIRIRKPNNCGSLYYNYKLYHSIILMAVVDVNYRFTMIDVGSFGKNSDGGVLEHSNFGKLLYANKIDLPDRKPLVETENVATPFVFVGDEAFRLSQHLMKPYPRRDLDILKRRFNFRLSHARQLVECTFGILVSKFRIFENSIAVHPAKVDKIINAACVLHNLIRIEEKGILETHLMENVTPTAFLPMQSVRRQSNCNQSTREAREIRDRFCNYFSGVGAVEWQDTVIEGNRH